MVSWLIIKLAVRYVSKVPFRDSCSEYGPYHWNTVPPDVPGSKKYTRIFKAVNITYSSEHIFIIHFNGKCCPQRYMFGRGICLKDMCLGLLVFVVLCNQVYIHMIT